MTDATTPTHTTPMDDDTLEAHQLWIDAVKSAAAKAFENLPDMRTVLTQAYQLVMDGKVIPLAGGGYDVSAGLTKGAKTWRVDGHCACPLAKTAHKGYCAHKLATLLYLRANDLVRNHYARQASASPGLAEEDQDTTPEEHPLELEPIAPPQETDTQQPEREELAATHIPERYIVHIHGVQAVRFVGLLLLAHDRGLMSLTADWTFNDTEISLAHARATFSDGRVFEEAGDATPDNVGPKVKTHFRRVALTRAKARVLRDALGVELVAVEELER